MGLGVPVAVVNEAVVLAEMKFLVFDDNLENLIYIENSGNGNLYFQEAGGGKLVDFYQSSGDVLNPVFAINPGSGSGPTPVQSETWGGVKSLYR